MLDVFISSYHCYQILVVLLPFFQKDVKQSKKFGFCLKTKVDILIFKFKCNEKSTRAQSIEVVPKNNFRHTSIYMHKDND